MRVKPRDIILEYKREGKVYPTASKLGIHPTTVYRWVKRARTYRGKLTSRSLARKSTKPRIIHTALSIKEIDLIIRERKKKNAMAEKIIKKLGLSVHPSTVHRLLQKKHLVREYGYHIRPRFQDTLHMHLGNTKTIGYLQMDVKYITPELSGLPWTCFEYAVIDIFSHYKEAVILNHLDQDGSISSLLEIVPKLPFKPLFLQTDNGLEFQERFSVHVKALGINYHYIHKNTPNENALIERSFRTDEEEFFFWLKEAPQDHLELNTWRQAYLVTYNTIRPHMGINMLTPKEAIDLYLKS